MTDIAIRVEKLSKQFRIGAAQNNKNLREALKDSLKVPFRRAGQLLHLKAAAEAELDETIWALKDVSFEVKHGDIIGIIGKNGSGKSTLLKVLSRITEPTTGYADIYGRVGSLLEVGTGFHPELTGRENIFLNGAILGMKRTDIRKKFDEIVAFAEVDKFIDTPVKHYSSGMYLRLAFAVAAHLEPEILIVDEVLAVGDAKFQKKCMDKMDDVGHEGRTVLFVSHNMYAISMLCKRAVLLDQGRVLKDGPSQDVVNMYLSSGITMTAIREWHDRQSAPGSSIAWLRSVSVRTEDGQIAETVDIQQSVLVEMEYEVLQEGHVLLPNFHFYNENGVRAFQSNDIDPQWRKRPRPAGKYKSSVLIPGNFLSEGKLFIGAALITLAPFMSHFYERDVVAFHVLESTNGDNARGDYTDPMGGVVRPLLKWNTLFSPAGQANQYFEIRS